MLRIIRNVKKALARNWAMVTTRGCHECVIMDEYFGIA
jgi:hypothetical protein